MDQLPNCPKCNSEYVYEQGHFLVCPECAHEWSPVAEQEAKEAQEAASIVRDMNGNQLNDGDDIIIMQDLKVKGSSSAIKQGTKVKNIRILDEPIDGHDIDGKVDGFGPMNLKSEFVRKG